MHFSTEVLLERLDEVRGRIEEAAAQSGRDPAFVRILPVTKTHPAAAVIAAFEAGLEAVGENRVQEALTKMKAVDRPIRWELIGHLQSNKVKAAVRHFDRLQGIDSEKRVRQVSHAAGEAGKTQSILLQINAGRDPAKYGASLAEAPGLLETALSCPHIKVEGLMTIAPLSEDRAVARETFARLRNCRDSLQETFQVDLPELSMGMTGDLEEAVLEGSTLVRLGTVLFGERD